MSEDGIKVSTISVKMSVSKGENTEGGNCIILDADQLFAQVGKVTKLPMPTAKVFTAFLLSIIFCFDNTFL